MRLHLHPALPEAITVSTDGLRKWDLTGGEPLTVQAAPLGPTDGQLFGGLLDSAVSSDGTQVALALSRGGRGTACLHAWETLARVQALDVPGVDGFTALAFSPDGRWLAAADSLERVLLLDRTTGEPISAYAVDACYTMALAFDPSSGYLAGISTDQGGGRVWLLEVGGGSLGLISDDLNDRQRTWDFADTFATLSFSHGGSLLAVHACSEWGADTPGWQSEVMLFDCAREELRWSIPVDTSLLGSVEAPVNRYFNSLVVFAKDDASLLTGSPFGQVLALDTTSGALLQRTLIGMHGPVRSLSLEASGITLWGLAGEEPRLFSRPLHSLLPR